MDHSAPLPPPPDGDFLTWIQKNPEIFSAYLHRVYALSNLVLVITVDGETKKFPIKFGESNAVIEIVV